MTDAMEALFDYAQECLFSKLQAQEDGYNILLARDDHYEEQLRSILDEPGQKILDDFAENKLFLMISESKAAFQAGYRLAIELSR